LEHRVSNLVFIKNLNTIETSATASDGRKLLRSYVLARMKKTSSSKFHPLKHPHFDSFLTFSANCLSCLQEDTVWPPHFFKTFIYLNTLKSPLSPPQHTHTNNVYFSCLGKWETFFFGGFYGLLHPLWPCLPHVFAHFPIGYKLNTLHEGQDMWWPYSHEKNWFISPSVVGWWQHWILNHFKPNNIGCLKHDIYTNIEKV